MEVVEDVFFWAPAPVPGSVVTPASLAGGCDQRQFGGRLSELFDQTGAGVPAHLNKYADLVSNNSVDYV